METPKIIQVLEDAQLAHKAGDFVNALKFYEQFFDQAPEEDPRSLYGVRLSYCLSGWSRLADQFVGAKNRLIEKQQEVLTEYKARKVPEKYHDYYAISRCLDKTDDAISEFLLVNEANQESAARIVKFVWEDLIKREHWQVCNQFLDEPVQKMDESFAIFDEQLRLRTVNPQFATEKFENHIIESLIASVNELILVLRHNERKDDVAIIERKFFEIAHQKNHAAFNKMIQAKGAFLFGGH